MKNIVVLVLLNLFVLSCEGRKSKKSKPESENSEQKDISSFKKQNDSVLKNCIIDQIYFDEKTKRSKVLEDKEIEIMNLSIIEDINSNNVGAKIKIIDTLFVNKRSKIIVVSEEIKDEDMAFIVQIDNKGKAYRFENVFYSNHKNNSYSLSSIITDKNIKIITENNKNDPKKQIEIFNFEEGELMK